jgi:pSer/pThr/pTyr-binding forkhead associated (FHA) protein
MKVSTDWYSSPGETTTRYRSFVRDARSAGATWVRVIAEPIWKNRTAEEVSAWIRYESLLNLSFARLPVTLVCPYDLRSVPKRVVAGARRTHPELVDRAGAEQSDEFVEPENLICETG